MTKTEKLARKINDSFCDELQAAAKDVLGLEIETNYNIIALAYVSARADKKKLTKTQRSFIEAFERGYGSALEVARAAV